MRTRRSSTRHGTMTRLAFLGLACLVVSVGCGDDGSGAVETESQPGTGTGVLEVVATIDVREAFANSDRPDDFDTYFDVTVRRHGEPVVDAEVSFVTDSGEKPLAHGDDGRYGGSHAGYHGVYELRVVAGDDRVDGAVIVGPALHTITAPDSGPEDATLPAGGELTVRWDAPDTVEAVLVVVGGYRADGVPDSGAHTTPGDALFGETGDTRWVEVRRELRMGLGGGAAGSEMILRVRNRTRALPVE